MEKLAGTDVIVLMKTALKDQVVMKEAQTLSRNNFSENDLLVECFFRACPQGFNSDVLFNKQITAQIINTLETVKKEIVNTGIRKAFNYLQNARNASNHAVILENQINELENSSPIEFQHKAAKMINFLSKYIGSDKNRQKLASSVTKIVSGNLKDASQDLHQIFASINPSQNVRTAFVTVKQQIGEGYQMCPKAIFQTGRPIPMAISSCRDYCVDSRLNADGTVGCNYVKWLNENVITQEQALNLFNKIPVEQTTVNLEPGERTKFPMSDQDSQDLRVIRDEKLTEKITSKPWEEQLEESHNKNNSANPKPKVIATDEALEKMLKTMRDVFDEDDLDNLEAQLRDAVGE